MLTKNDKAILTIVYYCGPKVVLLDNIMENKLLLTFEDKTYVLYKEQNKTDSRLRKKVNTKFLNRYSYIYYKHTGIVERLINYICNECETSVTDYINGIKHGIYVLNFSY